MKIKFLFLCFIIFISSSRVKCQKVDDLGLENDKITSRTGRVPSNIKEDYSCMDDGSGINQGIDFINSMKNSTINSMGTEVTAKDENDFGDKYYEALIKENKTKFITSGKEPEALKKIMYSLLSCRNNSSGLKYTMHLIEKDEVNAFTCGGHIYVYTGLIKYLKSESELAFIIGHEVGHDEKGHIKLMIRQLNIARGVAGDLGDYALSIEKFMFPMFNQHNETEADFYGADLSYAAGYSPCKGIQVWNRMSKDEGNYNLLLNFLRSHPYSSIRFKCLKNHIKTNYKAECSASEN